MKVRVWMFLVAFGVVGSAWAAKPAAAPQAPPPAAVAPAAVAPAGAPGGYVGITQCRRCHGYSEPQPGGRVNLNEAFLWQNKDKHRNAFHALELPLAQGINKRLGLKEPTQEARCLACHSPIAFEGITDKELIADGISCEVCHGQAQNWLGTHILKTATHDQNVQNGMTDLKNPASRATVCLNCHLGNEEKKKSVDHELIAAGHPDLFFDLARFYTNMPSHSKSWAPDNLEALRAWGAGQASELEAHMRRISSRAKDKAWPEYAEMRCSACHHSLTAPSESWRQELGYKGRKPGNIPFNDSRFSAYRALLDVVNPADSKKLDAGMSQMFAGMSVLEPNREAISKLAGEVAELARAQIAPVASANYDAALCKKLFASVVSERERIAAEGHRAALHTAWLLHLLVAIGRSSGALAAKAGKVDSVLHEIDEHLDTPTPDDPTRFANPSGYSAPRFAEQVKTLGDNVKWN